MTTNGITEATMITVIEDEPSCGCSLGLSLSRTVTFAWLVPRALVTRQMKVALMVSSTV